MRLDDFPLIRKFIPAPLSAVEGRSSEVMRSVFLDRNAERPSRRSS